MLIDTHAHLYWDSFKDDFDEVIECALEAGVTTIVNVGVDVETSKKALQQAQSKLSKISSNFKIYSSIGIHPHESSNYFSDSDVSIHRDIGKLGRMYDESRSNSTRIVAVGECGLDFAFHPDHMKAPDGTPLPEDRLKNLQIKLFQAQIDLAKKLNLPLLVHCRDDRSKNPVNSECWDTVLEMIGTHPAILHCYSGLMPTTQKVLPSPNLLVSFAGTITYPKNDYLAKAINILPLDKIVMETDCPFLPPQSKRGQRNEPANVIEVAKTIAQIKNISLEEVIAQTTVNVRKLLGV